MFLRKKVIRSVSDLIKNLKHDLANINEPIWYRGQANSKWPLIPSIERIKFIKSETNFLKKFKQSASLLVNSPPNSSIDWLLIMQHYGVPTRLLDWSESPLVALYFSCYEEKYINEEGALWLLKPVELNKIDGINPEYPFEIPSLEDEILDTYTTESLASERTSQRTPIAILVPRNNTRMQAQLGTCTINHRDNRPIESLGNKNHVGKYIIPKDAKSNILSELNRLSFTKFQLFPELATLGEVIKGGLQ